MAGDATKPAWTFLTKHARVLLLVARDPDIRVRDLADACGTTERTVQLVIADLESEGYLLRTRQGRRNRYQVVRDMPARDRTEADHYIHELIGLVTDRTGAETGHANATGNAQGTRDDLAELPIS